MLFSELKHVTLQDMNRVEGNIPSHLVLQGYIKNLPQPSTNFLKKILNIPEKYSPQLGFTLWIRTGQLAKILDKNGDQFAITNQLVTDYNLLIDHWNNFIRNNKKPMADKWLEFIQAQYLNNH